MSIKFEDLSKKEQKNILKDLKQHRKKYDDMQPKESKSNRHFTISLIKSVVRGFAAICLMTEHMWYAGGLLMIAELLGIAEEL